MFYNDCEAIIACTNWAWTAPGNDGTVDLHFLIAENVWSCAGYFQTDYGNYFTIEDSNVGAAYGYAGA